MTFQNDHCSPKYFSILTMLLTASLLPIWGCQTMKEDISDLTRAFNTPSPTEAAIMAWDQHDADLRRRGTLLLSNAPWGGNPPYLRLYRNHVQYDENPLVIAVAARALARHGEPEDALLIAQLLTHSSEQVRWEAAKGLQRLHNPGVVGDLIKVLNRRDEPAQVREAAAIALGQYPQDRVFQALVAAIDARELAVNLAAQRSLSILIGRDLGLDPRDWLAWYNAQEGDRFAFSAAYLYPTYQRDDSLLEKMAFWSQRTEEHPSTPAGLEPADRRSTYADEESSTNASSSGG